MLGLEAGREKALGHNCYLCVLSGRVSLVVFGRDQPVWPSACMPVIAFDAVAACASLC